MKMKVFAILDTKANAYGTPFFVQSVGLAIRAFSDLVHDERSTVARHPDDFRLYELGTFDDATGKLESTPPVPLGFATEFLVSTKGEVSPVAKLAEVKHGKA